MPEPMDDDIPTFKCINSAERFYLLLSRLLSKRGKKDFAIKIRYLLLHFNLSYMKD